jgi:hypothetical protein
MNQASVDGILNAQHDRDKIISREAMQRATEAEQEIYSAANQEILELLQNISKPEKAAFREALESIAKSTSSGKLIEEDAQELLKYLCSILIARRLEGYLDKYPFWPPKVGHSKKRLSMFDMLSPWTFLPLGRHEK